MRFERERFLKHFAALDDSNLVEAPLAPALTPPIRFLPAALAHSFDRRGGVAAGRPFKSTRRAGISIGIASILLVYRSRREGQLLESKSNGTRRNQNRISVEDLH